MSLLSPLDDLIKEWKHGNKQLGCYWPKKQNMRRLFWKWPKSNFEKKCVNANFTYT